MKITQAELNSFNSHSAKELAKALSQTKNPKEILEDRVEELKEGALAKVHDDVEDVLRLAEICKSKGVNCLRTVYIVPYEIEIGEHRTSDNGPVRYSVDIDCTSGTLSLTPEGLVYSPFTGHTALRCLEDQVEALEALPELFGKFRDDLYESIAKTIDAKLPEYSRTDPDESEEPSYLHILS